MTVELIRHLSNYMTEDRWSLFQEVVTQRTRHITVILEDIYQPHNASAVLRTCDCFGIQDVHVIENRNEYTINPEVALGASKWLDLYKYNESDGENTVRAINELQSSGYCVVATSPHIDGHTPDTIEINKPLAILLGTEGKGLSETAFKAADDYLRIPMYGFTESFNLSVSASLIIHRLTERLRASKTTWELSQSEKEEILLNWMRQSIRNCEHIEKEFYSLNG